MMDFEKIRTIPDKPHGLASNTRPEFGYTAITETIIGLLNVSPRPFTIGLFGKWGTGKSTIVEDLRKVLPRKEYIFSKFDVWKYENDALRRSFLISIATDVNKRLRVNKINIKKLKRDLYETASTTGVEFKPHWGPIAVGLILAYLTYLNTNNSAIAWLPLVASMLASVDFKYLYETLSTTKEPLGSPEQFEYLFRAEILPSLKNKTLVIAIDNLDRTQKEKTVELLSTIKTFLNSDESKDSVIFIVTADDIAIKEHIKSIYSKKSNSNSEFDASEFLQKFFNVSLHVPDLIDTEVDSYIKRWLKQAGLSKFAGKTDSRHSDIGLLVSLAYRNNPREIKQFINNLVAYIKALYSNLKEAKTDVSFILDNASFITKLIIIREKFNPVFLLIRDAALINKDTWPDISSMLDDLLTKHSDENSHDMDEGQMALFNDFHNSTKSWANPGTDFIAPFFNLRRSDEEEKQPGWTQFISSAISGDVDGAEKVFKSFKNLKLINNLLLSFSRNASVQPTKWFPFLSTALDVLSRSKLHDEDFAELSDFIEYALGNYPSGNDALKVISHENFTFSVEMAKRVRTNLQERFLNAVKSTLQSSATDEKSKIDDELLYPISLSYIQNRELMKRIRVPLQKLLENPKSLDLPTFSLISDSDIHDELLSDQAVKNFIDSINFTDDDEELLHIEIQTLTKIIRPTYLEELITKINQAEPAITNSASDAVKILISIMLERIISEFKDEIELIASPTISTLSQHILNWYQQQEDTKTRFIKVLIALSNLVNNSNSRQLKPDIERFLRTQELKTVSDILNGFDAGSIEEWRGLVMDRLVEEPGAIGYFQEFIEKTSSQKLLAEKLLDDVTSNIYGEMTSIKTEKAVELALMLKEDTSKSELGQKLYTALESLDKQGLELMKRYTRIRKNILTLEQKKSLRAVIKSIESQGESEE